MNAPVTSRLPPTVTSPVACATVNTSSPTMRSAPFTSSPLFPVSLPVVVSVPPTVTSAVVTTDAGVMAALLIALVIVASGMPVIVPVTSRLPATVTSPVVASDAPVIAPVPSTAKLPVPTSSVP